MTLITFEGSGPFLRGGPVLRGGKIGAEQACCCCCAGDTLYRPDATVSVTEDIEGCGGAGFIDAPDLPMILCGVFEGPCTIVTEGFEPFQGVYKAIYNRDGTWQLLIDDFTDNFFLAVPIPGTGGNAAVPFPCQNDPEGPLDRTSDVTITVTGVCEQYDDPP